MFFINMKWIIWLVVAVAIIVAILIIIFAVQTKKMITYKRQIENQNNTVNCPFCFAENESGKKFCSKCGNRLI